MRLNGSLPLIEGPYPLLRIDGEQVTPENSPGRVLMSRVGVEQLRGLNSLGQPLSVALSDKISGAVKTYCILPLSSVGFSLTVLLLPDGETPKADLYRILEGLPVPAWVISRTDPDVCIFNNFSYAELPPCLMDGARRPSCVPDIIRQSGCGNRENEPLPRDKTWLSLLASDKNSTPQIIIPLGLCGTWCITLYKWDGDNLSTPEFCVLIAVPTHPSVLEQSRYTSRLKNLQAVASNLQEVRETERVAIARELHDSLGQEVSVLRMELNRNLRQISAGGVLSRGKLQEQLSELMTHVDQMTGTLRRIVSELRNDVVSANGLLQAASDFIIEFRRRVGLQGNLELGRTWVEPDAELAQHLYRSLQELLNNIAKHAKAIKFNVELLFDGDTYNLTVTDDGVGLPEAITITALEPTHVGLRSLTERAAMYRGEVILATRPSVNGTRIIIKLKNK